MRIPFRGPNDLKRMRLSQRGPVTLNVTIYPGDKPPTISGPPNLTWEDIEQARRALMDAWVASSDQSDVNEAIRKAHENRKVLEQIEGQNHAAYADEHPWLCEFCERARFKTERGCKQHEARCRKGYCPECKRTHASCSWVNDEGHFSNDPTRQVYTCKNGHTWEFPYKRKRRAS